MSELASNLLADFGSIIQLSRDWYLMYLPVLQSISLVVSTVLFFGIIYCIIKSDFLFSQLDRWLDALGVKDLPARRAARGWRRILRKMKTKDPVQWKWAIDEADKLTNDLIRHMGIKAETMSERLEQVNSSQLSNIEEIKNAHQINMAIKRNSEFELSREEADRLIKIYAKTFREFNLID